MHQQSRPPRGGYSPATAAQTNPTRTNNPRDALASRPRAASEVAPPSPSFDGVGGGGSDGGAAPTTALASGGPTKESIKKLDQIIQNFHLKAAVLILQARIPTTPSGGGRGRKTNKWFQIETEDIDDFKDELKTWKHCGGFDHRPPPMIIETYLDASRLAAGQALVVIDDNGKRWDALEALNSSDMSASGSGSGSGSSSSGRSDSNTTRSRSTEIILERWKIELQCIPGLLKSSSGGAGGSGSSSAHESATGKGRAGGDTSGSTSTSGAEYEMEDFGPILPTIYKRSIVFFRSLFVTTHVLPAYRFSRQASTKGVHPALKVRCRILTGAEAEARIASRRFDNLRQPLNFDNGRDVVTDYMFGDLEIPVGRFSASVTYRNDCSFRIDDSESLLSSRFMGIDENYFRPSLPPSQRPDNIYLPQQRETQQTSGQQHRRRESSAEVVGSLPSHQRSGRNAAEPSVRPLLQQTYGSLSTFHGADALGTSPITALKAARTADSETSSPTGSYRPSSLEQRPHIDPPNSLPIAAGRAAGLSPTSSVSTKPPMLRNLDAGRRTSISFQPFKAGSLSGSPRTAQDEIPVPSSPLSGSRPMSGLSALAQARNRSSLTAGMAASLRAAPQVSTSVGSPSAAMTAAVMDPGQSSSPRLAGGSRFSSSFTHRRGRSSFGGASRNEDDQGSSGRQSLASSMAQPGSGLLAEVGGVASSGSFQTDDDNISEFLKALESKKTLQSFESSSKRVDSARRTAAQLSRFQLMRESNVALTDSMNSSLQMPRSLSSSGRHPTGTGTSGASGASSTTGAAAGAAAVGHTSTSLSPSSHSPIKPLSPNMPHAPHTPAVPSRLSENAIVDYQGQIRVRPGGPRPIAGNDAEGGEGHAGRDADSSNNEKLDSMGGTTAIDIPLSPRLLQLGGRRSSSAVQKTRAVHHVDDNAAELAAFAQRSLSVGGAGSREPPSPGALFRLDQEGPGHHHASTDDVAGAVARESAASVGVASSQAGLKAAAAGLLRPASGSALSRSAGVRRGGGGHDGDDDHAHRASDNASSAAVLRSATVAGGSSLGSSPRRRYMSRHQQASTTSTQQTTQQTQQQQQRGETSSSGLRGSGGGYGETDDEPLVFDLSELGRDPNRQSIDESRRRQW
ncbi:autophagy protein [Sporothrix brasiliensis 5110]|uniref:Autophagy-related protein 13 n=1 Tax=Sporothrix brasiliensis 5110 TaxID=1398154 RepID=A0A0C2FT88_9PEZI|nr:autophagy protein [Sporothrix brasiliensis 5110]KIH94228.1 autophagy protein [Sporothrix brasiliensis 5110]